MNRTTSETGRRFELTNPGCHAPRLRGHARPAHLFLRLLLAMLLLSFSSTAMAQLSPPGGGGSGGGGGGGGVPYSVPHGQVLDIIAWSDTSIKIQYELFIDVPNDPGFTPYYMIMHSPGAWAGQDWDREKLPSDSRDKGIHWTPEIVLQHPVGFYQVAFVTDLGQPNEWGTFRGDFRIEDGTVTFNPNGEIYLNGTGEVPVYSAPDTVNYSTCGTDMPGADLTANLGLIFNRGSSALSGIGDHAQDTQRITNQTFATGCGSCGGGGPEDTGPTLEIRVMAENAIYPSSLGLGVYTTYDSSLHCFMVNNASEAVVRLVDTATGDVVSLYDNLDGSPVDGILHDELSLYREARLGGAGGLVTTLAQATKVEVERYNGEILTFELHDDDDDPIYDKDGSLTKWEDTNGHSYDVNNGTVTDPYGRTISGQMNDTIAGRPALTQATLPSGGVANFSYADDHLSQVEITDPTTGSVMYRWTNSVAVNAATQTVVWDINNPGSGQKKYHYTQDYIEIDNDLIAQPGNVLKQVSRGSSSELSRLISHNEDDSNVRMVQTGQYFLASVASGFVEQYYGNWTVDPNTPGYNGYSGNLESTHAQNTWIPDPGDDFGVGVWQAPRKEWALGAADSNQSLSGIITTNKYDPDLFLTEREWPDGTTEDWSYDFQHNVTRYSDRLGRVIKYNYDSNRNLLEKHVGYLDDGAGGETAQPEAAVTKYEYTAGRLTAIIGPLNTGQSDMYRTDFQYGSGGQLTKKIESADEPGGQRPETVYAYNAQGGLASVTDPVGRVTSYLYDAMGRKVQTTYNDGSTEQIIIGDVNDGGGMGQIVKSKDRNDVVTTYAYDTAGRLTTQVVAAETDQDLLDGVAGTPITDATQKSVTTYTYLDGLDLPDTVTTDGRMASYIYDYRGRVLQATVSASYDTVGGQSRDLISKTVYDQNQVFYTEDPYGRRTYTGYRTSDRRPIRQIQTTTPDETFDDNAEVIGKNRDLTNNAPFIISDVVLDAEGQSIQSIDPRGTITGREFNSRGQMFRQTAALGTSIEAVSEMDYDLAGQVVEARGPRYFDATDPQSGKVKSTFQWTGRGLSKSQTIVPDVSSISATTSKTYFLDGRADTSTDPRGYVSNTYWHNCCGRMQGASDPLGHGYFTNNDYQGRVTHSIGVSDYASHADPHNPDDGKTLSETTTRYDDLGRVTASTVWLTPRGAVNEQSPPIAGLDGVSVSDGLTTQAVYDSNLTDDVGLDSVAGQTIEIPGGGSWQFSLTTILAQLETDTGISFMPTSAGSAALAINAEGEIAFQISDGAGRPVMAGQLQGSGEANPGALITWQYTLYDQTWTLAGFGDLLETRVRDASGNITTVRSDGAGRALQTVDADGNVSTAEYDASGAVVKSRDANGVGADVVYDELGRVTSRTDTYGNTVSSTYDRSGNVLTQTDAKGKVTSFEYDARNRLVEKTDRIGGDTIQTYDRNSNLLSLVDAESKTTQYTYDERNQKLTEVYADHVAGTSPGQAGYGTRQFAYDDAGRLLRSTDQDGNTITPVYDLAGRVTQRDYRTLANSPSGQIQDSDTFTHDRAGRILTAHTQRYSNTVTMTWDEAGRAASESLNIGNQTYTTSRTYDNHGRLSGYTNPDGTTVARTYTSRNQLNTISYDGNVVDTRAYDIGGRITSSTYGNGVVAGYSYRDDTNGKDNRLASITTTQPGGATDLVGDYSYTYDANGNKLSESITGVLASYGFTIPTSGGYDDEERLTAWNRSDGNQDQSWVLSLVGDWTSFTEEGITTPRMHSDTHEVESIGSDSLTHDLRGNLTHNGARNHDYIWDMDNKLVSADTDSNGSVDASYQYDALGRRASKTTSGSTTVYVSSGQQVLAEYALGAAPSSPNEVYVYGSYIDEPILKDGTGGLVYYSQNVQYSVVALTNSSGSVVERYRYDAYGAVTIMNASGTEITSSAYANAYLFTGRRLDAETGLYYFRARYYDAKLGRFLSRDPLGYVDGMSLYRGYMVPNGLDPLGTFVLGSSLPGMLSGGCSCDDPITELINRICGWSPNRHGLRQFECRLGEKMAKFLFGGEVDNETGRMYNLGRGGCAGSFTDVIVNGPSDTVNIIVFGRNCLAGKDNQWKYAPRFKILEPTGDCADRAGRWVGTGYAIGGSIALGCGAGTAGKEFAEEILDPESCARLRAYLCADEAATVGAGSVALAPIRCGDGLRRVMEIRKACAEAGDALSKRKNIAYAEINTTAFQGELCAISGQTARAGFVTPSNIRLFRTKEAGGFYRGFDSEAHLLEDLAKRLCPDSFGTVRLFSERPICAGCQDVIRQFQEMFPKIKIVCSGGVK